MAIAPRPEDLCTCSHPYREHIEGCDCERCPCLLFGAPSAALALDRPTRTAKRRQRTKEQPPIVVEVKRKKGRRFVPAERRARAIAEELADLADAIDEAQEIARSVRERFRRWGW